MEPFKQIEAVVAPFDRANIDTDAIIPKQFLKSIKRTGFGVFLFDEWRYLDQGQPDMDISGRPLNGEFVLNQPAYKDAKILLTQNNFGCGSSREHAPWALVDFGFRVILAKSYADIFYNNCFKNSILPIVLPEEVIDGLFEQVQGNPGMSLKVDLSSQTITTPSGDSIAFDVDPFRKHCLLEGLDDIGLTLNNLDDIETYEVRRRQEAPWLFAEV
jgi:3-isopropylmalate/(R)-2-methylmalate dehydratase small subunit